MKVEVAVLGSPSLIVLLVSVDVKQHGANSPSGLCGRKAASNLNCTGGVEFGGKRSSVAFRQPQNRVEDREGWVRGGSITVSVRRHTLRLIWIGSFLWSTGLLFRLPL